MNAKYTSKPNFNPNEANLFGFVCVIPAQAGIQTSPCRQKNKKSKSCKSCLSCLKNKNDKNEPNFFTTKYALSISKTQKWRPKTYPKKRNEPICG
jgi:hypothetical protein